MHRLTPTDVSFLHIEDVKTLARGITDGLAELVALATPTTKPARRSASAMAKKAAQMRKAAAL